jgi:hypothetical protein
MEYDIIFKNFLSNDENIIKKEFEYSIDFLKCKIEKCYGKGFKTESFENCKEDCMNRMTKFNLLREFLYQDFSKFYYNKFFSCVQSDEDNYNKCIADTKQLMERNIIDIKKLILNYSI